MTRSADDPGRPVNINYVYGLSDTQAQEWMPGPVYFALLFVGLPLFVFLPTHLVLRKVFPPPARGTPEGNPAE